MAYLAIVKVVLTLLPKVFRSPIHIDFAASALIYPGGAIIVEVFYRIFPVLLFL